MHLVENRVIVNYDLGTDREAEMIFKFIESEDDVVVFLSSEK